jgi:hypothetical protein
MSLLRFIKYFTWEKRVFLFKKSNLTSQLLEKFANSVDLTRGRHAYMIFILFYFLLLFKTLFDPISLCWSLFLPFSSQERQEDNYAKTTSPKNFYSFIHSFLFILFKQWFFFITILVLRIKIYHDLQCNFQLEK